MGLELVGGQSKRESGSSERIDCAQLWASAAEKMAQAERELADARARLQGLVDRAAELRRRLVAESPVRPDLGMATR